MPGRTSQHVAVATRVANAASSAAAPEERAHEVLAALRHVVPFVAGELACWDPVEGRYETLANDAYPEQVLAHLNGHRMVAECDELGVDRSGAPTRMRDVPPDAQAASGTISQVLRPTGYREGVTMCLRTGDGRVAGLMNLSVDDERHPTDDACDLLRALNQALANVCDATQSSRWVLRVLAGDVPAVAVTRTGAPVELSDGRVPSLLEDGSGAVAAAHAMLGRRRAVGRFVWPSTTRGEWYAVSVIPCDERALPSIAGVVSARPGADVHGLTRREVEVLTLIAEGLSNAGIAGRLVLSPRTVSKHVEQILRKLGTPSRAAAAARAIDEGLLLPSPGR
jgi:DNA-binding CsgD family transcriptional regulator